MEKLGEKIRNEEDFKYFMRLLSDSVNKNTAISDNKMYDGMVIGLIACNEDRVKEMMLGQRIGDILDGTYQKLECIAVWLTENEETLYNMI